MPEWMVQLITWMVKQLNGIAGAFWPHAILLFGGTCLLNKVLGIEIFVAIALSLSLSIAWDRFFNYVIGRNEQACERDYEDKCAWAIYTSHTIESGFGYWVWRIYLDELNAGEGRSRFAPR